MTVVSKLQNLVELAKEKSSDRRRVLMREVTDLFFEAPPDAESQALDKFDDVLSKLAEQTAIEAREELALRFSNAPLAPRKLILKLAQDAIGVAAPILTQSHILTEDDLMLLAESAEQDHLHAISQRKTVTEKVSETIVRRGDDKTVAKLVENEGAQLSRKSFEAVTERAESSPTLHEPLINRDDTPTELLGDLMLSVENRLRDRILKRFNDLDPKVLEIAMAASHKRLTERVKEDQDIRDAREYIQRKAIRKQLDGALLARLLRKKEMPKFCVGFAELANVDFVAAHRAIEEKCIDPLALICKSAGFQTSMFVTLAVLRSAASTNVFNEAQELGKLYESISAEDADRALRFWRMRKDLAA
jgi:uncharacterized protein (DUF2336 family)